MMKHILIFAGVTSLAVFNGIFSPYSFVVFALQGIWYPSYLPSTLNVMFILSGIISALAHFLITGIPSAVLEKRVPLQRVSSGLLWLGVMLLPTAQTLRHLGWF
jgi:hypothetical protein